MKQIKNPKLNLKTEHLKHSYKSSLCNKNFIQTEMMMMMMGEAESE